MIIFVISLINNLYEKDTSFNFKFTVTNDLLKNAFESQHHSNPSYGGEFENETASYCDCYNLLQTLLCKVSQKF